MPSEPLGSLVRDSESSPAEERSLLVFELAGQLYALPTLSVERIIEMVTIQPVPQEEARIEGVINVHGALTPVVNLARVFGLPVTPLTLRTPMILTRTGAGLAAVIVSHVLDVRLLPAAQVLSPATFLPPELDGAPLIEGIVRAPEGLILVLDLPHLFTSEKVGVPQIMDYLAAQADAEHAPPPAEQAPSTGASGDVV